MPPPLRREILDSEDEDTISPVKACSPVATFTSGEDAPLDMDVVVDQATSTASTAEQLRRAHLDLMAPTQDADFAINVAGPAGSSTVSPLTARKKRRLTGSDPEPDARSSGKLKRIKTVTDEASSHSSEMTVPGPTYPDFALPTVGTSDTIAGVAFPSVSEHVIEKQTPKTRTRRSSQQHTSSGEQINSLTPWSVSVIGSSDRLNSDDAAVGFPKELYKPRPSRSRSAQVDVTPFDYHMVPEKAARKAKRAKTDTKDTSSSESVFPPRPILQAPEYERLSPPPSGSDINPPELQNATLPETIPESAPLEPPPSSKSQKNTKKTAKPKQPPKRNPSKKQQAKVEEPDGLASTDEIVVAETQTPKKASKVEVQVVISPSRPLCASSDMAHDGHDPMLLNNILAGLGHTKSTEPTPQPAEDKPTKVVKVEPKATKATKAIKARKATKPSKAVNIDPPADEEPKPDPVPEPEPEPELSETPEPAALIAASKSAPDLGEIIKKTPQPTKNIAAKSSPTKPGWQRTPLRVGLSKTQRIPSLLKVFKK